MFNKSVLLFIFLLMIFSNHTKCSAAAVPHLLQLPASYDNLTPANLIVGGQSFSQQLGSEIGNFKKYSKLWNAGTYVPAVISALALIIVPSVTGGKWDCKEEWAQRVVTLTAIASLTYAKAAHDYTKQRIDEIEKMKKYIETFQCAYFTLENAGNNAALFPNTKNELRPTLTNLHVVREIIESPLVNIEDDTAIVLLGGQQGSGV